MRAAMEFSVGSKGSSIEGSAVQCVPTPVYSPWALVGAPIKAMLTPAGDAWSEFVLLLEGNGAACVFAAPEGRDRAAGVVTREEWGGGVLDEQRGHAARRLVGARVHPWLGLRWRPASACGCVTCTLCAW